MTLVSVVILSSLLDVNCLRGGLSPVLIVSLQLSRHLLTARADNGVMQSATATELVDSSGLLGDWRALRSRIASDGYVFVRGLLDPAMAQEVGRTGLAHLQAAGWTAPAQDPVDAAPRLPIRAVKMRDAFADRGYLRILADPGFNHIPFTQPVVDLMGRLLGPAGFCYPLKLARVVYPSNLVPHQPGNIVHKDYGSVQDMLTCWVPLGEVPRTLGGLALKPGSQHTTRVRYRPLDRLEPGWVTVDYQPGDVLVFHCLTTHAALPNREGRLRFSAEYRWQLADQPAPRRLVIGPQGREIGSRHLARLPWWRPVPSGLTLFDDDGIDARPVLPAPPSRLVAFDS
jgi:Phytanoyl-CoA dioxygenase (PhyH)